MPVSRAPVLLPEHAEERCLFDAATARLYGGSPLLQVAAALETWAKVNPGGSYAAQCAIMANECAKAHAALAGRRLATARSLRVGLPWSDWNFWPWLRYVLSPKGRRAQLPRNHDLVPGDRDWKLHRCADNEQCRATIGGGCAGGYCEHFEVRPDEAGIPRFPIQRFWTPGKSAR